MEAPAGDCECTFRAMSCSLLDSCNRSRQADLGSTTCRERINSPPSRHPWLKRKGATRFTDSAAAQRGPYHSDRGAVVALGA